MRAEDPRRGSMRNPAAVAVNVLLLLSPPEFAGEAHAALEAAAAPRWTRKSRRVAWVVSSQRKGRLSSVDLEVELHDSASGVDGYRMERGRREPEHAFAAVVRLPRALAL